MANAFIRKLQGLAPLAADDLTRLQSVTEPRRTFDARQTIIEEGDEPEKVHLVMSGLAARHKTTVDGTRQIFAYLIPGDFCDLHVAILKRMDHSISTLTPSVVVDIPRKTILDLLENHPAIARALLWTTLVDEAVLREWLTNLGARTPEVRIAHLFCEIYFRMRTVGLADDGAFALPITQQELAETMGISAVHVNRSLMMLKDRGLVYKRAGHVEIPDVARLNAFADFNPAYLHLQSPLRAETAVSA